MNKTISYGKQSIDKDDLASALEALSSDWLTQGPLINRFEDGKLDLIKTLVCKFKRLFEEIFTQDKFVKRNNKNKIVDLGSNFN